MGIIHDFDNGIGNFNEYPTPQLVPSPSSLQGSEPGWDLSWDMKQSLWPSNYRLVENFKRELYPYELVKRAATFVNPENLQSIEAYVNTASGRYGLKGLRFRGNPTMGTVLLGDWREERVQSVAEHRMLLDGTFVSDRTNILLTRIILGPDGERIVELEVTYKGHQDGDRIIGLLVKTSHGREHDVVNWRPFTDEPPPTMDLTRRTLRCKLGQEVVGFEYVMGVSALSILMSRFAWF